MPIDPHKPIASRLRPTEQTLTAIEAHGKADLAAFAPMALRLIASVQTLLIKRE
jgi:hypothetical protein